MINKDFITYKPALALKELGFDEPCFAKFVKGQFSTNALGRAYKHNSGEIKASWVSAPTYSQAFRFFRENYDLQCWPEPTGSDRYSCRYDGNDETGYRWVGYLKNINNEILFYLNYEEAESACLDKLIEIAKQS